MLCCGGFSPAAAHRPAKIDPVSREQAGRILLAEAIAAQGGEEKLRSIHSDRIAAMRLRNAVEQSVRPEGPYIDTTDDLVEVRRFEDPALRDDLRSRGFVADWPNGSSWKDSTLLVTGGEAFAARANAPLAIGNYAAVSLAEESLALGPERLLLTATRASDLQRLPSRVINGFAHDVVGFTWNGSPVRIYLTPQSHVPAAVEITRPLPFHLFWSPWGDVTTRLRFDIWNIEKNGVHFPRRWTFESNGRPIESWFVDSIEFNPEALPAMDVSPALKSQAHASHQRIDQRRLPPPQAAIAVAPGITLRAGAWNVAEVESPDGMFVIEAPISSAYSNEVIEEAKRSGRRIAGVITTSDSWPHIAGLREYVANRIPVIALDLNRPVIERLLAAPHHRLPDTLARHPIKPVFQLISRPQWLGRGPDRMRLFPYRTATGERQFAIWWPGLRLLYTSDLFTVNPDGSVFLPQYLSEARDLVERERLDVKTVFGMHYGPTAWGELVRGTTGSAGRAR